MLGRGLESLIPPQHQNKNADDKPVILTSTQGLVDQHKSVQGPIFQIEVDKIKPNPHQPRKHFDDEALKDLASSIAEFGILQPLVVSKIENVTDMGRTVEYQLIAGERRLLAAKMVGLERVPVVIKAIPEEREKLELAIVENLQRENLNSIETARAYAKLQDHFGLTQREVAVRLGKSREVIGNAVRLLGLPTYIQEALAKNQINESQGRLLLAMADTVQQQSLFNDIISNNLSVREIRSRLRSGTRGAVTANVAKDPEMLDVERELEELLGTKVQLEKKGSGGKIMIDFYSNEELQAIIDRLASEKKVSPSSARPNDIDAPGGPPLYNSDNDEFHV